MATKKYPRISFSLETITPKMATEYLQSNRRNRSVSEEKVRTYAGLMAKGKWNLDGNTIKFDWEGNMIDGQHRLLAIIRSKVPIETFVVRGTDPQSFDSLDRGRLRNAGQIVAIDKQIRNGHQVASAALLLAQEEQAGLGGASWNVRLEPSEILDIVHANPGLIESVSLTVSASRRLGLPAGILGWAHYRFNKANPELCATFFDKLFNGVLLSTGDPVHTLRERLGGHDGYRSRLNRQEIAYLIVRAWNATVDGQKLTKLQRIRSDAQTPDTFPEIRGMRRKALA